MSLARLAPQQTGQMSSGNGRAPTIWRFSTMSKGTPKSQNSLTEDLHRGHCRFTPRCWKRRTKSLTSVGSMREIECRNALDMVLILRRKCSTARVSSGRSLYVPCRRQAECLDSSFMARLFDLCQGRALFLKSCDAVQLYGKSGNRNFNPGAGPCTLSVYSRYYNCVAAAAAAAASACHTTPARLLCQNQAPRRGKICSGLALPHENWTV